MRFKINNTTAFSSVVFGIFFGAFVALVIHRRDIIQEVIGYEQSVIAKEQSVKDFAEGGEIRETRFPYSWVVRKPDGSVWWFDALGGRGAEKINKELLWEATHE
jgi:hypothetical protein